MRIGLAEGAGLAPGAGEPIEAVRADYRHLGEPEGPGGHDLLSVIMGGVADRGIDLAGERRCGDAAGVRPARAGRADGERAVAGEGELAAAAGALRPLIDDAADAVRIGRVADPVEHDLGDGALA